MVTFDDGYDPIADRLLDREIAELRDDTVPADAEGPGDRLEPGDLVDAGRRIVAMRREEAGRGYVLVNDGAGGAVSLDDGVEAERAALLDLETAAAPRVVDAGGPIVLHMVAPDENPDEPVDEPRRHVETIELPEPVDADALLADADALLEQPAVDEPVDELPVCDRCGERHTPNTPLDDLLGDIADGLHAAVGDAFGDPATMFDPRTAANILLGQIAVELRTMLAELERQPAGLVTARSVHARVSALTNVIDAAVYPTDRLVSADMVIRTDGERLELQVDGTVFPWALHAENIGVDYLAGGMCVVRVPMLAHKVRLEQTDGRVDVEAVMHGEPVDDARTTDLGASAADLARKARRNA